MKDSTAAFKRYKSFGGNGDRAYWESVTEFTTWISGSDDVVMDYLPPLIETLEIVILDTQVKNIRITGDVPSLSDIEIEDNSGNATDEPCQINLLEIDTTAESLETLDVDARIGELKINPNTAVINLDVSFIDSTDCLVDINTSELDALTIYTTNDISEIKGEYPVLDILSIQGTRNVNISNFTIDAPDLASLELRCGNLTLHPDYEGAEELCIDTRAFNFDALAGKTAIKILSVTSRIITGTAPNHFTELVISTGIAEFVLPDVMEELESLTVSDGKMPTGGLSLPISMPKLVVLDVRCIISRVDTYPSLRTIKLNRSRAPVLYLDDCRDITTVVIQGSLLTSILFGERADRLLTVVIRQSTSELRNPGLPVSAAALNRVNIDVPLLERVKLPYDSIRLDELEIKSLVDTIVILPKATPDLKYVTVPKNTIISA